MAAIVLADTPTGAVDRREIRWFVMPGRSAGRHDR